MSSSGQHVDARRETAGDVSTGAQTSTAPPTARPLSHRAATRAWATVVLIGCLGTLGVAAHLDPKGRLYGTHEDLFGTGPCGMLVVTGLPCPTCGMTTAFAYFVRGRWLMAAYAQPAGFVLALGTTGLALVSLWALITGRWPRSRLALISPYRLFLGLLVLLVGGWAFKIASGLLDGSLPYPGQR